jgi:hypothetical protein
MTQGTALNPLAGSSPLDRPLVFGDAAQIAEIKRRDALSRSQEKVRRAKHTFATALEEYGDAHGVDDWLYDYVSQNVVGFSREYIGMNLVESDERTKEAKPFDASAIAELVRR